MKFKSCLATKYKIIDLFLSKVKNTTFVKAVKLVVLIFVFCCLLVNGLLKTTTSAQSNFLLILGNGNGQYPLGHYLSFLEDKTKRLTIEDVSSTKFQDQFILNKEAYSSFGFSKSAYWLKFSVRSTSTQPSTWLLEIDFPRLNKVDLYEPTSSTTFIEKKSGSSVSFKEHPFVHRNFVFPVEVTSQEKTFYLRVESITTISIPATIWEQKTFQQQDQTKLLFLGIYYGIFLVLIVYNLFLYFATKDRIFVIYVMRAFTLAMLQFSFDGFAGQYLWPTSNNLTNHSIQFFSSLLGLSLALLIRDYLYLKENSPTSDKVAKVFAVVFGVLGVVSVFLYSAVIPFLLNFLGFIAISLAIIPAVICLKKNFLTGKYFFISISTGFLGAFLTILRNANMIDDSFLVHYSLHFGSAFQVIVLSLGLADRVRLLQEDKEKAEIKAMVKEKDNEIFSLKNVELTEANLKLRELDQIKANFTAMLVHDLKSPLAVVRAALEILSSDDGLQKSSQKMILASERSINKILNLVNEVLDLYRSESQEMRLELKPVDMENFIKDFSSSAKLAAVTNNISVDVKMSLPLPKIMADVFKLERVFSNLTSNAIKFTPSGGTITIEMSSVTGTGVEKGLTFLRISITDTGEGIAAEEIPYLFEPYRQGESRKKAVGVGLGLAIVKRIVAAHGGNISVRSQIGVGSCFTVILPAKVDGEEDISLTITDTKKLSSFMQNNQEFKNYKEDKSLLVDNDESILLFEKDPSNESLNINTPNILLVEDDNMSQLLVKRQLQQLGYKIDIAVNGREALEVLKTKTYSLILMDCNMPVMDGYETTLEIRHLEAKAKQNNKNFSRIPIIALTANNLQDSERCFQVGMDDFLEKPFRVSQIKNILEKWLMKA